MMDGIIKATIRSCEDRIKHLESAPGHQYRAKKREYDRELFCVSLPGA